MKKELNLTEFDDKTNNVIPFARPALITGGPTLPDNWLQDLKSGTLFVAKDKHNPNKEVAYILNRYMLMSHKGKVSNLLWAISQNRQEDIWVPTLEFSRRFELIEVLAEVELVEFTPEEQAKQEKKISEEETNG